MEHTRADGDEGLDEVDELDEEDELDDDVERGEDEGLGGEEERAAESATNMEFESGKDKSGFAPLESKVPAGRPNESPAELSGR